jgi:hypothetical protein
MKQLLNTFQQWMSAITFAEAGEWETARQMSPVCAQKSIISQFDQTFMATAFAEEGLYDEAVRIAEDVDCQTAAIDTFLQSLGLDGVRTTYLVLAQ